ncbi:hypothetical protein HFO93_24580 [Rhizobium leguminosarum]|nr:hypothetical protein [Rhizobium leguminosarum]
MAYVGTVQKSLEIYDENNNKMIDIATSGIGRLVDADMETTASKLRALQTQQQLAIQSLAIANTAPGNLDAAVPVTSASVRYTLPMSADAPHIAWQLPSKLQRRVHSVWEG